MELSSTQPEIIEVQGIQYQLTNCIKPRDTGNPSTEVHIASTSDGQQHLIKRRIDAAIPANTLKRTLEAEALYLQHQQELTALKVQGILAIDGGISVRTWIKGSTPEKELKVTKKEQMILKLRDMARSLSETIFELAKLGLVHNDIKPSNIVLPDFPNTKLEHDPTEARVIDLDLLSVFQRTEYILGTPYYMPPEKCGYGYANNTTDIYGLGMTIISILIAAFPGIELYFIRSPQRSKNTPQLLRDKMMNLFINYRGISIAKNIIRRKISEAFWNDMETVVDFAISCIAHDPRQRPLTQEESIQRLYYTGNLRQI